MQKERGPCPKCGRKVRVLSNKKIDSYLAFCTCCDWVSEKRYFRGNDGTLVLLTNSEALASGYAKECPYTNKVCPTWEIQEIGMSIEEWHRRGKGSLTI